MRLYSQFQRLKLGDTIEPHLEFDLLTGENSHSVSNKMTGAQPKAIGKWLAEKDTGNDSEPELSTFSNLNISAKPLHTRPSRAQSRATTDQQKTDCLQPPNALPHSLMSTSRCTTDSPSEHSEESRGFTRCLRSRAKQSNKMAAAGCTDAAAKTTSFTKTERNNNGYAGSELVGKPCAQYPCCDNKTLINRAGTLLTMTIAQVPARNKARSRAFDASSLYSVASDDFNESDDELISINGDSNSEYNTCSSVQSPRLSSKRKRTTTLSADLEVASLLSPSVEDCFSSGDNISVSDYSESEEPVSCDIPRKRMCGASSADDRPFLDLEKMQDEVEKSVSMTNKRRPKAIRIMCFSPIKNISGLNRPTTRSQYNSRELVMATQFCPLAPTDNYS